MANDENKSPSVDVRHDRIVEFWVVLILTTAGLLSAWASYQSGIWNDREIEHFHRANAALTRSSEVTLSSGQREIEQSGVFVSWLGAVAEGQERRAAFFELQFKPPFDAEFARWRKALPVDLHEAPRDAGGPGFIGLLAGAANDLIAKAEHEAQQAARSGLVARQYARWMIVLATTLFLAGMATAIRRKIARSILVGLAGALTLVSLAALAVLPRAL
jgi:hypothetical protein